jgi:reactive intermediate/imine deaminase
MKIGSFALLTTLLTHGVTSFAKSDIEHYTTQDNISLDLPFSEAVRVGNTVYLAGQIGVRPGEKNVVLGGVESESEQALKNIELVLNHFHIGLQNIVRCQIMLADISEWTKFNVVYKKFFTHPYPARSAFAANGLALNARVEIECIAAIPNL